MRPRAGERVHVLINTHNRLPLIRKSIPRILSATSADNGLSPTHTVYDDGSDAPTREYLLSLLDSGQIDNLILGGGGLADYRNVAQTNNPFVANYLQVLRACLFVAPAPWVLHFTDDALLRFTGVNARWLLGWISAMKSEPRIVSMQMTDYEVNLLSQIDATASGLPMSAKLYRTNFVSDRYTLYRYADLFAAFESHVVDGQYPLAFEEWLNKYYAVAQIDGRWAVVCQWDEEYIGTHIGPTNGGIEFTDEYVCDLLTRLDNLGANLSLSQRVEFR